MVARRGYFVLEIRLRGTNLPGMKSFSSFIVGFAFFLAILLPAFAADPKVGDTVAAKWSDGGFYVGTVTGKNHLNIAALSLGRQEKPDRPGAPLSAITLIETDQPVPEPVIAQLLENQAVRVVRSVEFRP